MRTQDLDHQLEFLAETSGFIKSLTANLTETELTLKPSGRDFSCLEQVCHLRDIEREGYSGRIQRILKEVEPLLPNIDGDQLAIERNYNSQNLKAALDEFASARKRNLEIVRSASTDALTRTAILEDVGTITFEHLIIMMYEHDQEHRQQLSNLTTRFKARVEGLSSQAELK